MLASSTVQFKKYCIKHVTVSFHVEMVKENHYIMWMIIFSLGHSRSFKTYNKYTKILNSEKFSYQRFINGLFQTLGPYKSMNEHNIQITISNKTSELKQVLHTHSNDRLYKTRL